MATNNNKQLLKLVLISLLVVALIAGGFYITTLNTDKPTPEETVQAEQPSTPDKADTQAPDPNTQPDDSDKTESTDPPEDEFIPLTNEELNDITEEDLTNVTVDEQGVVSGEATNGQTVEILPPEIDTLINGEGYEEWEQSWEDHWEEHPEEAPPSDYNPFEGVAEGSLDVPDNFHENAVHQEDHWEQ